MQLPVISNNSAIVNVVSLPAIEPNDAFAVCNFYRNFHSFSSNFSNRKYPNHRLYSFAALRTLASSVPAFLYFYESFSLNETVVNNLAIDTFLFRQVLTNP